MAEEKEEGGSPAEHAPKKPGKKIDIAFLLMILNAVGVGAAIGAVVYTKILYKKPVITEEVEIKKVEEVVKKNEIDPSKKVIVNFDQMTVNIALTDGKAHFATVTVAVEVQDDQAAANVNALKAICNDKLIKALAKRELNELNTIQGRLLFKTELLREFNSVINAYTKGRSTTSITDIYFDNFILQ